MRRTVVSTRNSRDTKRLQQFTGNWMKNCRELRGCNSPTLGESFDMMERSLPPPLPEVTLETLFRSSPEEDPNKNTQTSKSLQVSAPVLKELPKQANCIGEAHTQPFRDRLAQTYRSDGYTEALQAFRQAVRTAIGKESAYLRKIMRGLPTTRRTERNSAIVFQLTDIPAYEIWVDRKFDNRSGVRYVRVYDLHGSLIEKSHTETGGVMGGLLAGLMVLQEKGILDEVRWVGKREKYSPKRQWHSLKQQ